MVEFYVIQIRLGTITLDDIPERWREKVREKIENQDESTEKVDSETRIGDEE